MPTRLRLWHRTSRGRGSLNWLVVREGGCPQQSRGRWPAWILPGSQVCTGLRPALVLSAARDCPCLACPGASLGARGGGARRACTDAGAGAGAGRGAGVTGEPARAQPAEIPLSPPRLGSAADTAGEGAREQRQVPTGDGQHGVPPRPVLAKVQAEARPRVRGRGRARAWPRPWRQSCPQPPSKPPSRF